MEKENLTNEKLRNKFTNQFELVSYAIKIASNMIKTGRAPRVKSDTQNVSMNVLSEIAQGKDILDDIQEVVTSSAMAVAVTTEVNGKDLGSSHKSGDRKKSRITH